MKNLNNYTEEATTQLLKENGAFFAFSDRQFDEQQQEGVKYISIYGGLICPKDNADNVINGLKNITKRGIALDIAENGKEAIIKRELDNHEIYYTDDISPVVNYLKDYGFTENEIKTIFNQEKSKLNK